VQERLRRVLKIPSRNAAKKPLLTDKMRKKRLAFAKKYISWTEKDWSRIMFSDESTFRLFNPRSIKVRRPAGMSLYKHKYTIKPVKHSEGVMVWGCFLASVGRGGLFFLPKNQMMNGDVYMGVLEDHLFPFIESHGSKYFLQDGAPCHTSKKVMAFLKEKEDSFTVLDWPGNSPDLNPIENVWAYMKGKLKSMVPKNTQELKRAITTMWENEMPLDYFQKLSSSMPRRLKLVIASQGDMSKY
jgi:arsenate reductase-like glutaredoxin family protein